ncbi:MAG: M1 family metallopeptidase [Candidatus Marinimicrobia bacterium]|jgi:aminopeptidase N|nr:M1 family metallopeptidase [Candidatus Neomarinimicrobiota bacterium]MBT4053540.1 M1 family metallopeptidase [Candidatus Neomarinimicrobiota bacterium]MBT4827195.1 M1 family metallopeptidase [Candidatus Neomarinimicrobiota bacterium]MBT5721188.1 M1 family metallopeptidase [Candidatus Neomarinimicrobiota bacterium]MBT6710231.1 M1 family metallopeptidase [Candidatus Neomarinimicrobiota bacterium]
MKNIILLLVCTFLFSADEKAPSRRTRDRDVDIHHIKIDVTVDLEEKSVSGNVTHTLSAFNSSLSEFALDAEDMEIHGVKLNGKDISFNHSGSKVYLTLDKSIGWEDTVKVRLDYTANPRKGTYFIKPDETYSDKPLQAWTQGEAEDNHFWLPHYDYPNDKATFETILTVDKKFTALSNGELMSIKDNGDGTHTWHWHEHFPMVSYLISFAVGEYVKVEDSYNGIPVNYWVYEENKQETLRSFGLTTDMMKYFGDVTGIEYPYEKYDQVIIDDFMFGGMENITLTHNTDKTMHDEFAAPDVSSVGLVAHELVHQWYGDMLTTRNWKNMWLNEGFATFFARDYRDHKFGNDEGEYIRFGEINGYLRTDKKWRRPTVYCQYYEPMDLFDGNAYAKGSLILNMMRDVIGEDGFWRSIQKYTKDNQYQNVETPDLKKAVEEATGQNLDWFFKQWVWEPGYPEYDVKWNYNQRNKSVKLTVKQKQNLERTNIFKMPVQIQIDNERHTVWIEDKEMVYEVPTEKRPKMVIFNAGMRVPCKLTFNKSISEWILQLENGPHILDRIAAAKELSTKKGRHIVENALLNAAKNDPFWGVRKEAVNAFAKLKSKKYAEDLMSMAKGQDNRVRRAIWNALKNYKNDELVSTFLQDVISTDEKYYSVADAFKALVIVDTAAARQKVDALLDTDSHTDVIRKSAITYFGSVVTDKNYDRLKELVSYGGTTWDARPEAVNQLTKYVKTKPKTVDLFVDMLKDNSRDIRRNAVRALNKHGKRTHIGALDELLARDPIVSRDVRSAKKNILYPPKKPAKKGPEKQLEEANKKLDDIRKLTK